ncbi:hypothetical protein QTG54_012833 [Skeletonema marinoi]|uniref:Uncharacterized protein n=1 Tax=Skeletonema marinoi TaxID=267567 RepID=A0AAD8XZC0_9STRA|nr:hypothetical protein QTG54_012833 [Skeletonema marinoi]
MMMIHPMSPDLLIRPEDEGKAESQNEQWIWEDLSLYRGAEDAVLPSSRVESLHHTDVPAVAPSSLDDFLDKYPSAPDFILSIPSSNEHEHKLSLPADMPTEQEKKNEEEGSCAESTVSDLTEMTYRAELMKQAINIEFEKFRQQKKQQGVEAHPHAIAAMFARTMSCPNIQKSMDSFVNTTSVKMKAEARQRHHLEGVVAADDATSDPTIQMRVDELFVEFGVRPARSVPYELSEENTTRTKSRPSNEHGDVTDHHLDSIIQLKLQLAQKQAAYDLLSSKYVATLLQKSEQQKLLAENSSLKRENERLRAQLHQAGTTSAAANQLKSSFSLSSGSSSPLLALPICSKVGEIGLREMVRVPDEFFNQLAASFQKCATTRQHAIKYLNNVDN